MCTQLLQFRKTCPVFNLLNFERGSDNFKIRSVNFQRHISRISWGLFELSTAKLSYIFGVFGCYPSFSEFSEIQQYLLSCFLLDNFRFYRESFSCNPILKLRNIVRIKAPRNVSLRRRYKIWIYSCSQKCAFTCEKVKPSCYYSEL